MSQKKQTKKRVPLAVVGATDTPTPQIPVVLEGDCCGKCRFHLLTAPEMGEGLCRRYPATPIATNVGIVGAFAPMTVAGWCGEFAPVKVETADGGNDARQD